MGELTRYNRTVVRVCTLEPITEEYTKLTGCIQWEAMGQTRLFCRAMGRSGLGSCFVGSVWVVFWAWLGYKGTEGLKEHHVLTAGANTEQEVIALSSCTFTRPIFFEQPEMRHCPQIQSTFQLEYFFFNKCCPF